MNSQSILKSITIVAILLLGLYFFAQWQLKSTLDELIDNIGDEVSLSYDSARLTLSGTALIQGSELSIPALNIQMTVSEVEYAVGGLFDTLFSSGSSETFTIPDNLYIRYENANLVLNPAVVAMLKSIEQPSQLSALEASGCGQKMHLGINEYLAMGYSDINISGEFSFEKMSLVSDVISKISGHSKIDITTMTRFEYQFEISNIVNNLKEWDKLKLMPTIDLISLDVTDLGYNFRRNSYCAAQANSEIVPYLDNHIKLVSDALKSAKLKVTDDIKRTYRELLQPGSTVHLAIRPKPGFNFEQLMHYNEQELRDILGLEVKVNNFDLPQIFTGWKLEKFNKVVVLSPKQIAKKNQIKRVRYYKKPLVNAKRYINKQVKVIRLDGRVFEGILDSADGDNLRISTSYKEGMSQGPVIKKRIKSFYVYQ